MSTIDGGAEVRPLVLFVRLGREALRVGRLEHKVLPVWGSDGSIERGRPTVMP